jgi:pimeloyl-ACP methyl ester carboxylesterase
VVAPAEHYRVIAPDLPGYGDSDSLPANTIERTATMGQAICQLIDGCGAAVRLCGHSYGGNVALHAAIARPRSVQSLVLFEPVFFRALYLAGVQQALEPEVRFFRAYAGGVERRESAAVAEMIDYCFGAGSFTRLRPSARNFVIARAASRRSIARRIRRGHRDHCVAVPAAIIQRGS